MQNCNINIETYNVSISDEKKRKRRERQREWSKTEKGKECRRKWRESEQGKECLRKFNQSKKHKEVRNKWEKSPRGMFLGYKRRAKRIKLDFELSEEDFENLLGTNAKRCYYCGQTYENYGIDRVDNEKGYVIDNCVTCCSYCNFMKGDWSSEEFISHCGKVYENSNK